MKLFRIFFILSICGVFALSACVPKKEAGEKGPLPPPERIYANIDSNFLLNGLMEIFSNVGFRIVSHDTAKKYFKTDWTTSADGSNQRRMYEVYLEPDKFDEANLFLVLVMSVQEKRSGEWHDAEIDKDNDPQFQRILKEIDQMVTDGRGQIVRISKQSFSAPA